MPRVLRQLLISAAAAFLAAGPLLRAQPVLWTGTADWSSTGNWSSSPSLPGAADTAQISSGTVTVSDARSVGAIAFSGGAIAGTGTLSLVSGASTWSGGTMNSAGVLAVGSGATLAISGGSDHDFNLRTITNAGVVNWSGGRLRSGNGGSIVNSATWNDSTAGGTGAQDMNNDHGGTAWTFTNAAGGTYIKSGAGTTRTFIAFNNSGAVNINAGVFEISGGGSAAGSFTVASGASLLFKSSYSLNAGASLSGAGSHQLQAGTLTISGGVSVNNLTLSSGTVAGSHTFTGALNWTASSFNGAGTTTIGSGGTLAISSGSDHDFNLRSIVNNGVVNWSGGRLRSGNSGSVVNNAAWNDSTSGSLGAQDLNNDQGGTAWTFTNAAGGTYAKSGSGTTRFFIPFNNDGAVMVNAGTIELSGGGTNSSTGTYNAASGASVLFKGNYSVSDGTTLQGAGTYQLASGTLTISGTVNASNFSLSSGTLAGSQTFSGAVTWSASSLNGAGTTTIAPGSTLTISTGSEHDFNLRALVNNGTVNWNAGRLRSGNAGTITNNLAWNDLTAGSLGAQDVNNDYGGTVSRFINASTGTYTKSGSGTTRFAVPLDNNGVIAVNAGTLEVNGGGTNSATGSFSAASGASVLFQSNYTIANGSSLLGAGSYRLQSGTLSVGGTVSVNNFGLNGGTLSGTQTFTGGLTWASSSLNGAGTTTVGSGSTLTVNTGADHDFNQRAIVNNGTVNWTTGRLRSGNAGSITNNATFADGTTGNLGANDLNNDWGGTLSAFVNSSTGTYVKSGSGTTRIFLRLDNSGAVNVNGGTLEISGGGTNFATGTFSVGSGAAVLFKGSYNIANGSSLLGAGAYQLVSGTLDVGGTVNVNNFTLLGGTLSGSQTFAGGLVWTSGSLNGAGTTAIASGSTLGINSGADHDLSQRTITNNGTVNWSAGRIRTGHAGGLVNYGTWNDTTSGSFGANDINHDYGGSTSRFTNAAGATYAKSGAGVTRVHIPFDNSGTISTTGGELQLHGGGVFANGTTQTGSGLLEFAGGTFTADGTLTFSNLEFSGGSIVGTHVFNGVVAWTGGSLANTGSTTIGSGGILTISSGADHDFSQNTVVNNGVVNWNGGRLRSGQAGSVLNNGVWSDSASNDLNNDFGGTPWTFTNSITGTYAKSAPGETRVQIGFTNFGTVVSGNGNLSFEASFTNSGGTLLASGGSLEFVGPLAVGNGRFGGAGNFIAPSVTVAGELIPGMPIGMLDVTGNLGLLAGAASKFDLGGTSRGAQYDGINVTGALTLGGNLEVRFSGGFQSGILSTDTFTLFSAASLTGSFINVTNGARLGSADGLGSFLVSYGPGSSFTGLPNSVILSDFVPVPEPSTWAMLLTGAAALAAATRRKLR